MYFVLSNFYFLVVGLFINLELSLIELDFRVFFFFIYKSLIIRFFVLEKKNMLKEKIEEKVENLFFVI